MKNLKEIIKEEFKPEKEFFKQVPNFFKGLGKGVVYSLTIPLTIDKQVEEGGEDLGAGLGLGIVSAGTLLNTVSYIACKALHEPKLLGSFSEYPFFLIPVATNLATYGVKKVKNIRQKYLKEKNR